mmetsp:Transcript_50459/g.60709  ORF Transcript_50459/g.60709 Transcript_50459/m.60709 type:complete len:82 (+) Transcript_50459:158-403(+)
MGLCKCNSTHNMYELEKSLVCWQIRNGLAPQVDGNSCISGITMAQGLKIQTQYHLYTENFSRCAFHPKGFSFGLRQHLNSY